MWLKIISFYLMTLFTSLFFISFTTGPDSDGAGYGTKKEANAAYVRHPFNRMEPSKNFSRREPIPKPRITGAILWSLWPKAGKTVKGWRC